MFGEWAREGVGLRLGVAEHRGGAGPVHAVAVLLAGAEAGLEERIAGGVLGTGRRARVALLHTHLVDADRSVRAAAGARVRALLGAARRGQKRVRAAFAPAFGTVLAEFADLLRATGGGEEDGEAEEREEPAHET